MASFHAITATALGLRGLLAEACPRETFPQVEFRLFQSKDFQTGAPFTGLSIYLYRVTLNLTRRSAPDLAPGDAHARPPVAFDAAFALTAWAPQLEMQASLLGWTLRALTDTPVLTGALLNRFVGGLGEVFRPGETVQLALEDLSVPGPAAIGELAALRHQPSIACVARMLCIDSDLQLLKGV